MKVGSFLEFYANNTELAVWDANNTLVTVFFGKTQVSIGSAGDVLSALYSGINDVGKSFWWTNETVAETNARVLASYFERLALLRGEFQYISSTQRQSNGVL